MRIFIDTSFVLALTSDRDQHHRKAKELAAALESRRFLITDVVLIEIGDACARMLRAEAISTINDFLTARNVEVVRLTPDLFKEAFNLYQNHSDKAWGLTDCVTFVAMKVAGIQDALTHDRHFIQAGFRALMRDAN